MMKVRKQPDWFNAQPPVSHSGSNPYLRWLTQLGLVLYSSSLLFFLYEWYTIGVVADQEKIADYRFSTEPMLNEGGPHYASAAAYATAALQGAFVCLPLIAVFALAVWKGTKRYQLLALAAAIGAWLLRFPE